MRPPAALLIPTDSSSMTPVPPSARHTPEGPLGFIADRGLEPVPYNHNADFSSSTNARNRTSLIGFCAIA